jgi:four helix bundle protein
MHNYKNLEVWNMSIDLSISIYTITSSFPSKEQYGLTSQINRSAVSIPSNIAEGCGRRTRNDFKHFLSIALGSSFELETQLIIANKIGLINEKEMESVQTKLISIQKMLFALQKSQ